jgi:hypothetical protein
MQWISQLLFILCLGTGIYFFWKSVSRIRRNILLGKDLDLTNRPKERLKQMIWVALGQSKMVTRPVAAFFHIIIYVGFLVLNFEFLALGGGSIFMNQSDIIIDMCLSTSDRSSNFKYLIIKDLVVFYLEFRKILFL